VTDSRIVGQTVDLCDRQYNYVTDTCSRML